MEQAKFILSKKVLSEQVKKLHDLGLEISYSYKTNRVVGEVLQQNNEEVDFSIHAHEEIDQIDDKGKIWFFCQAQSEEEIKKLIKQNIRKFVIDNEVDLAQLIKVIKRENVKITLSLRMKFQEHRIGTGKYFVYGLSSSKVNELILQLKDNPFISSLGVHLHRKSQNLSEWEILGEIKESLKEEVVSQIDFVNLGGGLPACYISMNGKVFDYIFSKIQETTSWLAQRNIKTIIEPGRFLAAPCIKLVAEIIQKYDSNLIINTSVYKCAIDSILTETKILVS